jgi:hypothetical protein
MGTLGKQPARDYAHKDLGAFIKEIVKLSKKHNVPIESIIEAKKAIELERQNCLFVQNGDYQDEQMGGFGDILNRIAEAIENAKS